MPSRDVWITGVGCASNLGCDLDTLADNLLAGRSGARPIDKFDTSEHVVRFAAALPHDDGSPDGPLTDWPRLLRFCAKRAIDDAGLAGNSRIGLIVGIGAESLQSWEVSDANHLPGRDGAGLVANLRTELGLTGPSTTVAAACASGNVALGLARQWLAMGIVDIVLAGGADLGVTPMGLASFGNLGALSRRNDQPALASRPFDKERDGFVLADGGALLVLETAEHARRRSARVYGRVLGYGARSDAHHLVMPSTDSTHAAKAMALALADAGLNPGDVDYINAHATSTPAGDPFETRAIHLAFGADGARIPVSGTKSMTGHLLSAASALEAVIGLIAIQRNAIPPTINLDNVDPECPLNHVANQSREERVDVVLSNSFGFGGSNTALILGRVA